MFILLLIPLLAVLVLLGRYIYSWLKSLLGTPRSRWQRAGLIAVSAAVCIASVNLFSSWGIVLLHFWVFSVLTDLLLRLPIPKKRLVHYALPLLITVVLMGYGAWNMGQVHRTDYTMDTGKLDAPFRILLITDVHYDTIQDPAVLDSKLEEMNGLHPDLVVLGGDIVEEGTNASMMEQVFERLGRLKSTYGTFFVYGNHDRQLYSSAPKYTQEALRQSITKNGICILQDETAALNDDILLVGREDASVSRRAAAELIPAGEQRLVILADHQPTHAEENAAAGADIQLSGHTHAGQVWPIGAFLELFGLNYGHYRVDGSDVFVSSGFAGWGFTVRTSAVCEYAVIELR